MSTSILPPGPKSRFPLEHLFSIRKDILGFLKNLAEKYGEIAQFRIGPMRVVLINHPDYIKEVLITQHKKFIKGRPLEMTKALLGEGILTNEGEHHKRHSRIIQPAFHRKKMESYVPLITDTANSMMKHWSDGLQLDMKDEMTRMTAIIAGKSMFSEDVTPESQAIVEALDTATSYFGRIPVPYAEYLLKLPLPANRAFNKAKALLDQLIYRMIAKRRVDKIQYDDLLSILMYPYAEVDEHSPLSDQEIRDEAITLFLTSFDTTSTALTWTWYLLSKNAAVENEFHDELERVLEGRIPTSADINRLTFTRLVFTEAMRLFPPSYVIPRQANEDFVIDKYTIPRGTIILASPYLIHHDGRFYHEPEKFNPHRWLEPSGSKSSRFDYFPFSAGPRMCIGEPFAWMEAVLILAAVGQSWKPELVPGHPVELLPLINLRPKHGMLMTLRSRN